MALKDLFKEDKKETFISKIDMNSEGDPKRNSKINQTEPLQCSDTISWFPNSDFLTVKFCRKVLLEEQSDGEEHTPPFEVSVESTIRHYLKERGTLDSYNNEEFKAEISKDIQYFAYVQSGIITKVSLLISQITFTALGVPVILPPMILNFDKEDDETTTTTG